MINYSIYESPIGEISIYSKDNKLIGAYFENQKISIKAHENDDEILSKTKKWLDDYFNAKKPSFDKLDLAPLGTTFRCEVWKMLLKIPYGETRTYKEIADEIALKRGINKMSAQAVGGAVGQNPISIIIPCHRVIGSDGSLVGYAGGLKRKEFLLAHERAFSSL